MNVVEELIDHIEDREVEWVSIEVDGEVSFNGKLEDAIIALRGVEYYDGYGCQELAGVIWYTDGTWSKRGEYDGLEWWEHKRRPSIEEWSE